MSSPAPERRRARIGWKPFLPSEKVASTRLRCLIPCSALAHAGWNSEIFRPERAAEYDVVVFQKAYDPPSLELAARLHERGIRIVVDLCDNHFHVPDDRPELADRADRLRQLLDIADAVSVSTAALAELVPGRDPIVVDDALDPYLHDAQLGFRKRGVRRRLRLVWFGQVGLSSPPFGMVDVPAIGSELEQVHAALPLELTVISNSRAAYRAHVRPMGVPTRYRRWSERTFPAVFRSHDVCVLPVNRNPVTLVKTGNRVIASLMLGLPVVATRLPSYEEFAHCVLFEDWVRNISRYGTDSALAAEHVRTGQDHIRSTYTVERVVSQWSHVFESVLDTTGAARS